MFKRVTEKQKERERERERERESEVFDLLMAEQQIRSEGLTRTSVAVRDVLLECAIHRNVHASDALGVVVLHPYSWLGGCMYDHVVQSLFSCFASSGKYNTVVMYNARGVGKSSGRSSLYGAHKEVEDLKALSQFLLQNLTHPPKKVLLVGYSHGSMVASGVSNEPFIAGVSLVSPPLGDFASFMLGTKQLFKTFGEAKDVPKLIAMGSKDTFCSVDALKKKVEKIQGPVPVEVKIFQGANHFWTTHLQTMAEHVLHWAGDNLSD